MASVKPNRRCADHLIHSAILASCANQKWLSGSFVRDEQQSFPIGGIDQARLKSSSVR